MRGLAGTIAPHRRGRPASAGRAASREGSAPLTHVAQSRAMSSAEARGPRNEPRPRKVDPVDRRIRQRGGALCKPLPEARPGPSRAATTVAKRPAGSSQARTRAGSCPVLPRAWPTTAPRCCSTTSYGVVEFGRVEKPGR